MNTKKDIVQDPLFTIIGECSDQLQMQAFVIGEGNGIYILIILMLKVVHSEDFVVHAES